MAVIENIDNNIALIFSRLTFQIDSVNKWYQVIRPKSGKLNCLIIKHVMNASVVFCHVVYYLKWKFLWAWKSLLLPNYKNKLKTNNYPYTCFNTVTTEKINTCQSAFNCSQEPIFFVLASVYGSLTFLEERLKYVNYKLHPVWNLSIKYGEVLMQPSAIASF